jgi:hypothetical protein
MQARAVRAQQFEAEQMSPNVRIDDDLPYVVGDRAADRDTASGDRQEPAARNREREDVTNSTPDSCRCRYRIERDEGSRPRVQRAATFRHTSP